MAAVSPRKSLICSKADRILGATAAAVAAATGAGIVGTESQVDADVVYVLNVNIPVPNDFGGVYLNVLNGLTTTSGGTNAGWDINPYGAGDLLRFFHPGASGGFVERTGGGGVANVAYGTSVGPGSQWGTYGGGYLGEAFRTGNEPWLASSTGNILGFRFLNENTAIVNYGFLHMSIGTDFSAPRTIISYGYENSGLAITAVPEPSTMGLLVAGALGLVASRRRRVA